MNEIAIKGYSSLIDAIRNTTSQEDAIRLVKQVDAVKVALESVNRFHEESIKYARLEAEALLRVAQLGGTGFLRGDHKKTAKILSQLSEDDIARYIAMCSEGMTIDLIIKREVVKPQETENALRRIKRYEQDLVEEIKTDGITDLAYFSDNVRRELKGIDSINPFDLIDGARNRLRHAGAVGIGKNSGIYVMPEKASKDQIADAIFTRYVSVAADISAIKELAQSCCCRISYEDIAACQRKAEEDGYERLYKSFEGFYDQNLRSFLESIGVFKTEEEA